MATPLELDEARRQLGAYDTDVKALALKYMEVLDEMMHAAWDAHPPAEDTAELACPVTGSYRSQAYAWALRDARAELAEAQLAVARAAAAIEEKQAKASKAMEELVPLRELALADPTHRWARPHWMSPWDYARKVRDPSMLREWLLCKLKCARVLGIASENFMRTTELHKLTLWCLDEYTAAEQAVEDARTHHWNMIKRTDIARGRALAAEAASIQSRQDAPSGGA